MENLEFPIGSLGLWEVFGLITVLVVVYKDLGLERSSFSIITLYE